jgi:hypothetical protein
MRVTKKDLHITCTQAVLKMLNHKGRKVFREGHKEYLINIQAIKE